MEEVMNYLNENQTLFYIIGVCIVLAIILILSMKLFSSKEKPITDKEIKKKKEDLLEKIEKEEKVEKITKEIPQVKPIEEVKKEIPKVSEIKKEPMTEIKKELPKVEPVMEIKKEEVKPKEEEIEVLDFEDSKMDQLDSLLEKMQEDLEKGPKEVAQSYEAMQEENAIISYEELKKAASSQVIDEEENIPIIMSVRELEARNHPKEEVKQEIPVKETKKFKNTDIISPIYGKINTNLDYPKIPSFKERPEATQENIEVKAEEKSIYMEELEREQKQNEEFLQALKEFRQDL